MNRVRVNLTITAKQYWSIHHAGYFEASSPKKAQYACFNAGREHPPFTGQIGAGEIQFALIEGLFDKTAYHSELFAMEPFIGVCSRDSSLADQPISFDELIANSLIVREQGSGTREILEHLLQKYNLSITSFSKVTEIGNMEAIKQLVKDDIGITFLYQAAAGKELADGELKQITVRHMDVHNELNFVFLKGSKHAPDFLRWFDTFKQCYYSSPFAPLVRKSK